MDSEVCAFEGLPYIYILDHPDNHPQYGYELSTIFHKNRTWKRHQDGKQVHESGRNRSRGTRLANALQEPPRKTFFSQSHGNIRSCWKAWTGMQILPPGWRIWNKLADKAMYVSGEYGCCAHWMFERLDGEQVRLKQHSKEQMWALSFPNSRDRYSREQNDINAENRSTDFRSLHHLWIDPQHVTKLSQNLEEVPGNIWIRKQQTFRW